MPKVQPLPMTVSQAALKIYGESTRRTQRTVQRLIQRKVFEGVQLLDPAAKRPTYLIPEVEVDKFIASEKKRGQSTKD